MLFRSAFLQAVAITSDELEAIMCWNCEKFLKEMDKEIPMCITDLSRSSCMDIPSFYDAWKKGVEADGSFNGFFYLENLGADLKDGRAMLTLGAGHDKVLSNMLKARPGKGRDLFLHGSAAMVNFLFGEEDISLKDGVLTLTMPETALAELCEILKSHKGIYPLTSFPLTVEITATNITDQDGNVIKTIE